MHQECPKCGEGLFAWSCQACWAAMSSPAQCEDPPFPNYPCEACGQTNEELEEEEKQEEKRRKEIERIERGASYRQLEHRKIEHTRSSLYSNDPQKDAFNPKSLSDALRIDETTWLKLLPCVSDELAQQGYNADDKNYETILTPTWGKRVLTFFERSWLEENAEGLRCGVVPNTTGCLYFFQSHLSCSLRSLREGFSECFENFPTVPKVTIDEDSWQVSWEADPDPDKEDPREIYRTDGNKSLTLYEFILWCIRLGYALKGDFNPKYYVDTEKHMPEPIAYVPSDWVGRPRMWEIERDNEFQRFFWMDSPVYDWNGKRIRDGDLERMSRENMEHCCVCYGSPPAGQKLLVCECRKRLYCLQKCKDEYMEVHKYDPSLKHPLESKICCFCGAKQPELKRCGKCKYAFFCDVDCQRRAWDLHHKKQCIEINK